uniref:Sulfotransferase domain-containing protein n=1 Tax=Odontella aurita TaxID=265563 RepID=A0A6U6FAX7_9STRA|mmetsp:Transcript_3407/g.8843  ORF Transcript_3407/g.8843 Transcript_3407/m.8843 type:complete len:284 (+) Transcript_3407:629-1480(+)
MLEKFLNSSPSHIAKLEEWKQLPPQNRSHIEMDIFCNQGVDYYLRNYYWERPKFTGRRCTLQMNEVWPLQGYRMGEFPRSLIKHKYTIVRDPLSHVLSMFFHCTESKDHATRAHMMPPNLDDWLTAWANARGNQTQFRQNGKFSCYKPLDYQADYLEYIPDKGQGKAFLKNSFDVLGDLNRIQKSICAIFIKYQGEVPRECDCTNQRRLAYERSDRESHGVKHHGSTYYVTDQQRKLILESTRPRDVELYNVVQDVFQEQVEEIEKEHNFAMCEKFRTFDEEP